MRYISCEKHNFGVDRWIRIMFWGKAKEQKVTTIRPKNKLFFFLSVLELMLKKVVLLCLGIERTTENMSFKE